MKNLRKLLAVIITVAMMATMFVIPAFAAETSDADICDTLGMLKGTDGKVTDAYLATTPLRYQAAIMFLRLKGLEEEALAYKGTDNFDDAGEIWSDGQKMLAYLKANPELGFEGIGDNKFDPMGEMTAQAYYKVLLVALGYEYDVDFKWDEVFAFAKEIGLSKVADVKEFTVNDLAIATVEALNTNVRDEEYTLIEFLVAEGVVSEAAAIKAGLVEPEPEVLAVESVSADNLKQIYVEFNGADFDEDDVTDVDNYKVTDKDDKELDLDAADIDGNVVTLTLKNGVKNQTKVKVTVKKKILGEDQKFDLELIDTTLPKALDAKVVGISTIKFIFSEPIKQYDKSCFEIGGGDYYIKDVTAVKNNTELNVALYSALEEGDLEVKIKTNGLEDFAGFSVLKKTFKLDVVEDNEAPVVVGYKDAKPNSVTLIFNEDIEVVDGDKGNFYHTNKGNTVANDITDADIDGKELTLTFGDNDKMPEGTAYVYILKEAVRDLWENENDKIVEEIQVVVDKTPPSIKKLEVKTESQIVITFDEKDLDKDTAEDEDHYTLLDKKGSEVKSIFDRIVVNSDRNKVTIDFYEDLSGDYTIVIDGVEDRSGNKAKIEKKFTVDDKTDPDFYDFSATLYNGGKEDQMVKIDFGEKMATEGKYSVIDLEKYIIDGYRLADLDVEPDFKVVNDGKSIEIEIASKKDDDDGVNLKATTVRIGRVADAAGNYTKDYEGVIALNTSGNIAVDKAEAIGRDKVKVVFTDLFNKFDYNEVIFTTNVSGDTAAKDNALTPGKVSISMDDKGNTVATYDIPKIKSTSSSNYYYQIDPLGEKAGAPLYVYVLDDKNSSNKYGEKLVKGDTGKALVDKVKPTLFDDENPDTKEDYVTKNNDNTFVVQFSENIKVKDNVYAYAGSDLVVKADKTLVYGSHYEVTSIAGDKVTFKLIGDYMGYDGNITISLASSLNYIKDLDGNKLVDIDERFAIKNNPSVRSLGTGSDNTATKLVVRVSERLYNADGSSIVDRSDIAGKFTAMGASITSAEYKENRADKEYFVTFTITGAASGATIAPDVNSIKDSVDLKFVPVTWTFDGTKWN